MILDLASNEDHCVSYTIDMQLRLVMTADDLKMLRFDKAKMAYNTE
jgi:hypothetical protein